MLQKKTNTLDQNLNSQSKQEPPRHKIGLVGQWPIGADLQKHAHDIGAHIFRDKTHDRYRVVFPDGNPAFNKSGNAYEIKQYLQFMHQPLLHGLKAENTENPLNLYKRYKDHKDAIAGREILHRALRYALDGTPDVPEFRHVSLDAEGAECHEGPIAEMEYAQMQSKTSDIDATGKVDSYDPAKNKDPLPTALLPNTRFDSQKGFAFTLNDRVLKPTTEGEAAFAEWFQKTLKESVDFDTPFDAKLYLTPDQFQAFIAQAQNDIDNDVLDTLSQQLSDEDYHYDLIDQIENGHKHLSDNPTLQKLLAQQTSLLDPDAKLQLLLEANTALTELSTHLDVDKHWRFYHWTKRNENPFLDLADQVNRLNRVIAHYQSQGTLDKAKLSAIAMHPEFYKVFAFGRDAMTVIQGDIKRTEAHHRTEQDHAALDLAGQLKEIFTKAAPIDVKMSRHMHDEDLQEALETLEMATEQGPGAMMRTGKIAVHGLYDFWKDVLIVGPKEAPIPMAALVVGMWMYYKGIPFLPEDPETVMEQSTGLSPVGSDVDGSDIDFDSLFGEDSTAADPVSTSDQPAELAGIERTAEEKREGIDGVDYHWHETAWGRYKHWFVNSIEGTAKTIADVANLGLGLGTKTLGFEPVSDPAYMTGATNASKDISIVSFLLNLIQNGPAHFVMYARLLTQNAKFGPAGFAHFLSFFHDSVDAIKSSALQRPGVVGLGLLGFGFDTIDPMQETLKNVLGAPDLNTGLLCTIAGIAIGSKLPSLKRTKPGELGSTIMDAVRDKNLVPSLQTSAAQQIETLTEAAIEIEDIKLKLHKHKSLNAHHIGSSNVNEICCILDQMHLALATVSEDVGGDGAIYQSLLQGKIDTLLGAIYDFDNETITPGELQRNIQETLDDLIAAQIQLTGESSLYHAIAGAEPAKDELYRSGLRGQFMHSATKRAEANAANESDFDNRMKAAGLNKISQTYATILGGIDLLKQDARNGLNILHSAYVKTASGLSSLKHKKASAYFASALAAGIFLMDKAGYDGPGAAGLDVISEASSYALTALIGTGVFLGVNFVDDQVVVHGGVGSSFASLGIAGFIAYIGAISPVGRACIEQAYTLKDHIKSRRNHKDDGPSPEL